MSVKIEKKIKGYQVVTPDTPAMNPSGFTAQPERRLVIATPPKPARASLRWQKRPTNHAGTDGRTYMVTVNDPSKPKHKQKLYSFGVLINHYINGSPSGSPFEVWSLGDSAPRGFDELAKSLSMDMRSLDRNWLKLKLESLGKVTGQAFDMEMPNGLIMRMPSPIAAAARLIHYRCTELGAFSEDNMQNTEMVDALTSKKEPKTTAEGAESWSWDVLNPATGDDFLMTLKEVVTEAGQVLPISVWFAGEIPDGFKGIQKSLSFDMRVNDVDWVAGKLRQLRSVCEQNAGFMAPIPGSEKQTWYGSTIAYVAELILHRYRVLGLLKDDAKPNENVTQLDDAREASDQAGKDAMKGSLCPECDTYAMIRMDNCLCCTACGSSRC